MSMPDRAAGIMHARGMNLNETHRLLRNLIRLGTIAALDATQARCRVQSGELMTDWLAWLSTSAGTTRTWQPPAIGEQVLLLCPGGDCAAGVVVRGLYSDQFPAPSANETSHLIRYPDGARLEYDDRQHTLRATLPEGGTIHFGAPHALTLAAETITFCAPQMICTGNLTVQDTLSYMGGLQGQGGAAQLDGTLRVSKDVTAGGVSLRAHQHGGVKAGGDHSGAPYDRHACPDWPSSGRCCTLASID